ncbi:photosystem I reaction center subunit XII [Prochlorococcus sp. MIT 1341]|nr:photosystem I reaction center subunit XII [Prochlorococcus sp. MIT 1341]
MLPLPMDSSIDLAGLCLVVVAHAGILALRLGITLART